MERYIDFMIDLIWLTILVTFWMGLTIVCVTVLFALTNNTWCSIRSKTREIK